MIKPYYEHAGVTIYHGDCLDVLPTLTQVDHVITDPPYAICVVNTTKGAPRENGAPRNIIGTQKRRDLVYAGIDDDDRVALGLEIGRVAKRWALVFCDAESLTAWRLALEAGGLRHVRMGAWVSPACTPQFTGDRPGTGWEGCVITHGKGRSRWNGGGRPAVWIVNRPLNGGIERADSEHPTPKPSALMNQIVADYTDAGEMVLDPFAGSGTTLIAAKRLQRRAIGIEREERFCEVIAKRLQQEALPLEMGA